MYRVAFYCELGIWPQTRRTISAPKDRKLLQGAKSLLSALRQGTFCIVCGLRKAKEVSIHGRKTGNAPVGGLIGAYFLTLPVLLASKLSKLAQAAQ
jgi:hypothetical protein